jgi:signal transduction histidine kinase
MARKPAVSFKFIAVVAWLVTTLSLAGWWLVFGLQQIEKISAIQNASAQELVRKHRMLMSEGSFLFLLLLGGGMGLLYFIYKETRRALLIQTFFSAFTHDLKTSLASLRLQAESLEEDLQNPKAGSSQVKVARRLVKDTVRLELQLDNSLFLSHSEKSSLYQENLKLVDVIESMRHHWPELSISLQGSCDLLCDHRALESILKNILQNAVVHGKSTQVSIQVSGEVENAGGESVVLHIRDNGQGLKGERKKLGRLFSRHNASSGSGIGLYLATRLAKRMGGRLEFIDADRGFALDLYLKGRVSK